MFKVKRDQNIRMSATRELNLGTKVIVSKKVYNRKKIKKEYDRVYNLNCIIFFNKLER